MTQGMEETSIKTLIMYSTQAELQKCLDTHLLGFPILTITHTPAVYFTCCGNGVYKNMKLAKGINLMKSTAANLMEV